MPAVSTRGLGWLPDVPSIKDYTENSAEVSTLLTRTQVSSRVGSVSTKGGGRASAAAAAPALSPTVDLPHSVHRLKTNRHLDPAPLTQPQGSSSTSRSGRPDGISTHLACSSTKRRATCWGSPETPVLICAPLWVPWSCLGRLRSSTGPTRS